jgi:hypothetical protein
MTPRLGPNLFGKPPCFTEIPGARNSAAAKVLPPTVFILANGERLGARTSEALSTSAYRSILAATKTTTTVAVTIVTSASIVKGPLWSAASSLREVVPELFVCTVNFRRTYDH